MSSSVKTITDRPPTASFTFSPATPTVGQTVAFDASTSFDPDGTITNYSWAFGDGTFGAGVTTTHAYAAPNTYTVTLNVTDNAGLTGQSTASITVSQVASGAHVSFANWGVRPQYKKFSISKQGPIEPIQAFAVNDGNQTVWTYVQFVITGDGGVNQVLYTQVVQLVPGQAINGNQDPTFAASFVPPAVGTYFVQATVFYSASATPAPIGDPSYTANPSTVSTTFLVRQ
jgi:PKD repeat protein